MFSNIIVQNYELLKMICLLIVEINRLAGITTLSLLMAKDSVQIVSIDNEPAMQIKAKENLQVWVNNKRLTFCANDTLSVLNNMA
jgi:tRNA (cmo5U34)-methyltransferase